jgi:glycosyltransferase involved in cell wall biosynthesis
MGGSIDRLICLKFPATLMRHPDRTVWLLHQHRPAYELYDTAFGWQPSMPGIAELRRAVMEADAQSLGSARVFANSGRVAERLRRFNGIDAAPLYHPPADEAAFRCEPSLPYIFAPGRLESLKRQDLLLRGLAACRTPVQAIFAGTGGQREALVALSRELGLEARVRFAGEVSRAELIALYARCTAVFFGPYDEDYGYVTLEAMLSGKPVITCTDSGGPLEFVADGETGYVTEPTPEALAVALDAVWVDPAGARRMGEAGRDRYRAAGISWDHVVETLIGGEGPP